MTTSGLDDDFRNPAAFAGLCSSPPTRFRAWLARAKPGERLEYYRGVLALDRLKGTSALKEPECRKLAAVADHALALAARNKLHLLQERHSDGDYSYWAVARAPARGGPA